LLAAERTPLRLAVMKRMEEMGRGTGALQYRSAANAQQRAPLSS
jgi:hypothetical protein